MQYNSVDYSFMSYGQQKVSNVLCIKNELQSSIQSSITQRASITETKNLYDLIPYEIRNKTKCSITL